MATPGALPEIPISSVQGSGSFQIPANRYAIARAQVRVGEAFIINAVTVLQGGVANSRISVILVVASAAFVITAGFRFQGQILLDSGNPQLNIDGIGNTVIQAGVVYPVNFGPSASIEVNGSGGFHLSGVLISDNAIEHTSGEFRLKQGDIVSGGRYHIELYKLPGATS